MFYVTLTKVQYEYVRALLDNDKFELKIADTAAKEFSYEGNGADLHIETKNAFIFGQYKEV